MKLNIFAVAMSAAVLASVSANAQTTTVIETTPAPPPAAVVVEPAPTATVRSEKTEFGIGGILGSERRTTTSNGNCQRHTTQTNTLLGSSSKTTETCY